MERNHRTTVQGVVTSAKMDKTIVVVVNSARNHPLYGKRVAISTKYVAHDENNEAKPGDVVTIMACRPLSKTKRFRLVSVDQKHEDILTAADVEENLEINEGVKAEEPAPEEAE